MFGSSLLLVMCSVSVLGAPSNSSVGVVPLEKSQPEIPIIPILSQSEDLEANGTYSFSYETGNGIKREETAFDKVLPPVARSAHHDEDGNDEADNNEIHVQRGSYSYTAPDGTVISLRYVADENGFQPEGDHLPKAPTVEINNTEEVKTDNHISKNAQDKPDHESAASEHKETKAVAPTILSRSVTDNNDSAVAEMESKVEDESVTDKNDSAAPVTESKVEDEPVTDKNDSPATETKSKAKDESEVDSKDSIATETKLKVKDEKRDLISESTESTESTELTTEIPSTTEYLETPVVTEKSEDITKDTTEAEVSKETEVTTQGGDEETSSTDSATESDSSTTEITSTVAST